MSTKIKPSRPQSWRVRGSLFCFPALSGISSAVCRRSKCSRAAAQVEVFARSEFAAIASANIMVRSLERSEISRLFTISGAADETVRRFFAPYAGVYSWTGSAQRVFVASLQSVARGRARIFPLHPDDGIRHQAEYYFRCVHAPHQTFPCRPFQSPRKRTDGGKDSGKDTRSGIDACWSSPPAAVTARRIGQSGIFLRLRDGGVIR